MPFVVTLGSQKGGVGKSTIARTLAIYLTQKGYKVKIADMDLDQLTVLDWYRRRLQNNIQPLIGSVEPHNNVGKAIESSADFDFLILDTAGKVLGEALALSKVSHITLQPSNVGLDDLTPAVKRFNQLVKKGADRKRLYIIFPERGTDSNFEEAKEYLAAAGYKYIDAGIKNKDAYRNALNDGLALHEVKYPTLANDAKAAMECVVEELMKLMVK